MEKLNKDVIIALALTMETQEILAFCKTKKKFKEYVCDNQLFWMNKIKNDYPEENIKMYGPDYKQSYQNLIYNNINIEITINPNDEDEESEENSITIKSVLKYRNKITNKNLQNMIFEILSNFFNNEITSFGTYSLDIDGHLSLDARGGLSKEFFDSVDKKTENITIYFDAHDTSEQLDLEEDLLQEILNQLMLKKNKK